MTGEERGLFQDLLHRIGDVMRERGCGYDEAPRIIVEQALLEPGQEQYRALLLDIVVNHLTLAGSRGGD